MGITVANQQSGYSFIVSRLNNLEFGNVVFCGGRKTGVPGEKPSEHAREPTTNSTHIHVLYGVNTGNRTRGHIGGR